MDLLKKPTNLLKI